MEDFSFRQIHLDFHTSEFIDNIGKQFSKKDFQEKLQLGHVSSINIFAKCHHGWAYHPSKANEIHPNLSFDLLGEMIGACHEIGVKAPIYISAGLDEKMARRHPEWLIRDKDEKLKCFGVLRYDFMEPGYHEFCFNSPYLDYLIDQIEEIVTNYPCDGLWLDIVGERECYCQNCVNKLLEAGKDPRDKVAVKELAKETFANYIKRVKDAVYKIKPGTKIFHNSGHIHRGRRDLLGSSTHIEVESLPTGGWGYESFPISARYVQNKGKVFLGMTGKFHTTWGEFGGYKHPNALRYEAALCLANGSRCSIGDQMHPEGFLDEATYDLIGKAYSEVEAKEEWCNDVKACTDVAFLTLEAVELKGNLSPNASKKEGENICKSDIGTLRVLQEGNFLFDVIDLEDDFLQYKVVILPDYVRVDNELKKKLNEFINKGGKILATGESGLDIEGKNFAIDLGVEYIGTNEYNPDYFKPNFDLYSLKKTAFVQYSIGQKINLNGAKEIGCRENPYFNREVFRFSSHQHTPNKIENAGAGMTEHPNGIYIAWNMFEDYGTIGSLPAKEILIYALNKLLDNKTIEINLPSQGITTLMHQESESRYINHILYASPIKRGEGSLGTNPKDMDTFEVIEDLPPLYNIKASINVYQKIKKVYLAPQMEEIEFVQKNGKVSYEVPKVECHQMVVLEYY